jgi:hypothetical protein
VGLELILEAALWELLDETLLNVYWVTQNSMEHADVPHSIGTI